MATYGKKTQTDNKHLSNLTTARSYHVDGSNTANQTIRNTAGRLLRVVVLTKGVAMTIRDGTDVKGVLGTGSAEGTYDLGIYCNTNININGISGTGSVAIVFDE